MPGLLPGQCLLPGQRPLPGQRLLPGRRRAASAAGQAGLGIAVAILLAPVLLLPGLAWGAAGRLRPVWYPPGWLAAARLIDASPARGSVLLLPWAAYRTRPGTAAAPCSTPGRGCWPGR